MNTNQLIKTSWRVLCVMLGTIAIVYFWENTILLTTILLVLAILINIYSSSKEILFYIIVAILATAVESFATSSGAWVHSTQQIFNIPFWLALYWGMGGLTLKDIYLIIEKR